MQSADKPRKLLANSIEPITSLAHLTPHACDNVGSTMNTRSLIYVTQQTAVIMDMRFYSHGVSQRKSAENSFLRALFILKIVFCVTSAKTIPSNSGKSIWSETLFSINIFQMNTFFVVHYLIISLM